MTDSLLPDNRTSLEVALEKTLRETIANKPSHFPSLWRADEVSVDLLPWLAEAKGVDEWDGAADEAEQRATIDNAWPQQREAGMRVAIRRAIEPLGFDLELKPWYATGGNPYTLTAVCWSHARPFTDELSARLVSRVSRAVSERDELTVKVGRQLNAAPAVGAFMHVGKTVTSYPYQSAGNDSQSDHQIGVALHLVKVINSYPEGT